MPIITPYDQCLCGSGKKSKFCCGLDNTKCGLCNKKKNLTQTFCCNNTICDDHEEYALFSFATNSCEINHLKYTVCGSHYSAGHTGAWQDCKKCLKNWATELYVYYGTNEFNFEKLKNPPAYKPTRCHTCSKIIKLGAEGCVITHEGYICESCSA
jgi:hypothetical protein